MNPAHSLVICTYNRRAELNRCLDSVLPDLGEDELIVIDDGSSDDTHAYLSSLPPRPGLRTTRVANQGLSVNRDLGKSLTSAPWITYLDDDAWVPEGWLGRLRAICSAQPPEIGAVGGPVRLPWSAPPPAWLHPDLVCYLTHFEPLPEAATLTETIPYVGANMTLSRAWLEKSGGFARGLGRKGGNLLSREETQLWNRLRAVGASGRYDPSLWLWHDLPPSRLRRSWFLRRLYWEGISWKIETSTLETTSTSHLRRQALALRSVLTTLARQTPRFLLARDSRTRFKTCIDVAFNLGMAVAIAKGLRATP